MIADDVFIPEKLPDPLTKIDLLKYLELSKNGNIEARNKIIVHNLKLVINYVLTKFSSNPYDKSEMVSVGIEGLIRAVDSYDKTKNVEFSTYATKCIHNAILNYIRGKNKEEKPLSFEEIIPGVMSDTIVTLKERLADKSPSLIDNYENYELNLFLINEINKLRHEEKMIMLLYFGFYDGKTYSQREISKILYISHSNVARILNKNIMEIAHQLFKQGFIEDDKNKWILAYKKRYK